MIIILRFLIYRCFDFIENIKIISL